MNDLTVFKNESFGEIRTLVINGEPWFVGKDVATILGYAKPLNALAVHVDDDDSLKQGLIDSMGRTQETIIINESGLYSLVLSSKLPTAKQFKRWITSDVLPTIRKTGGYVNNDELFISMYFDEVDESSKEVLRKNLAALRKKNEIIAKQREEIAIQNQQIAEMQPKATYYDVVLNCKDLIPTSVIAKDYGKSAKWMNQYLHDKGIQFKQGDIWLLYQKYASNGYTSTKTYTFDDSSHVKVYTYWTQKGRLFIYECMKSDGYLPIIEQEDANE